jgi:hypothetical protein
VSTSTENDDGTSNAERIATEIERAAQTATERFPGYSAQLAHAAMECYLLTAEHDEQRININQKYDEAIRSLAREIGKSAPERSET